MFVERSTQYTSFSSRKQPADAGTEQQQQQQHFISPHNIQEIKIYNVNNSQKMPL